MPLFNPTGDTLITSGNYTGNSAANRAIPHSLGRRPVLVILIDYTNGYLFNMMGTSSIYYVHAGAQGRYGVTDRDATNFYVGNAGSYAESANLNALAYYWVAIG